MIPALWKKRTERWTPFNDLELIRNEMNKLFNSSFDRWNGDDGAAVNSLWTPAIDVVDAKNEVRIQAEIPGLNKEDIKIAVDGDTLTITGEKKQINEVKEGNLIRTERAYGSFYRAMTLPQTVDSSAIKAAYKNGVLELTLPKKEEAKPKQITVDVN